jgi:heptosyltransferase-2
MRIIVLPLYGIGDVLMSTPALRNLKEQTGAEITCLHMFKATKEVLDGNPNVDENIHFPFLEAGRLEDIRFLLGFRGKFDASINFYPSNRMDYNLAAYIIGCPVRIGHRYVLRDLRELNFLKNRTVKENDCLHNVEEDLRLLDFLGLKERKPYPLELHLTDSEIFFAGKWLKERAIDGRPLVGFHPGSSVFKEHAKKRWPLEKFSAAIGELSGSFPDMAFLLFGGREETPLKELIRDASGTKEKVFVVDTDSIRQTAAIIEKCRIFIANDSGLMHLSAALQVPTVAIFGPTNPVWLRPWMCRHRVISLGASCGPCFRYSPMPQRCLAGSDFSCVREIQVAEVVEAASDLLGAA